MPTLGFVIAGVYLGVFVLALFWNMATHMLAGVAMVLRSRQVPDEPSVNDPASVITLVHGTWARRAAWTRSGSPLCVTLARAAGGPVVFERFVWSGRNSLSARQGAVHALTRHLHAVISRWPRARHYVVAHSHGGNIAFHALGDPLLREQIRGLVCLSTPFLTVMPRDLGPVGPIALWWLPVVLIFYGGVFVLQQVAPEAADTVGPVLLVAAVAAGFLTARRLKRFATSALDSLDYPVVDPSKVLIVRTAGDEASAALGATHIISWISGRLWLFTSRALGRAVDTVESWRAALIRHRLATGLGVVCAATVGILAFVAVPAADVALGQRIGIVSGVVLLLVIATLFRGGLVAAFMGAFLFAAIAAPFLLIVALVGMSVGPELLAAGLLFQVTAETTPPGRWVVWQVPTGRGGNEMSGLMHSASYHSPAALDILERWFAADTERRTASVAP